MKSSDRYARKAAELIVKLCRAETLTVELESEVTNFCALIRRSRWIHRYATREQLFYSLEDLRKNSRHFKLIQGGNEFLARQSRAVLTLIITSELNNEQKVG